MAEQQDASLLERADSQSSVVNEANTRSRPSDLKIAGFVLLACMLIAGQGLTAYFVINQKGQISSLEKTADLLKIKLTQRPRGSSAGSVVRMPMYNTPLLMMETTDMASKKKTPMKKLEDTVTVSVQKQVKDLLKDFPLPQFNETFLTNLQGLKDQMGSEWKAFESWMQHWLVFQMAQQKHPAPTPVPVTASPIKTKCQLESGEKRIGSYRTQCDKDGNYLPMQCWHGTGYCWCVDKEGVEIPNTMVRGRPMCGGMAVADRMMAMPSLTRLISDNEDGTQ